MYDDLFDQLLDRMEPLARVRQNPRYHPEGDALYHALQTFDLARDHHEPPHVIAAALFHDVGKSSTEGAHEDVGSAWLTGIADETTCFLVAHHMDLLRDPSGTRRLMRGDPRLEELTRLRHYDDQARELEVYVTELERALGFLLEPGIAEAWLDPLQHVEDAFA